MKTTKRFLVHLETNWCGEGRTFSAIAEQESDLWEMADRLAYENFNDFDSFEAACYDTFGDSDEETGEYTEDQKTEIVADEGSYYSYTIEEFKDDEEEWRWYDLEYDCTEKKE